MIASPLKVIVVTLTSNFQEAYNDLKKLSTCDTALKMNNYIFIIGVQNKLWPVGIVSKHK